MSLDLNKTLGSLSNGNSNVYTASSFSGQNVIPYEITAGYVNVQTAEEDLPATKKDIQNLFNFMILLYNEIQDLKKEKEDT